MAENENLVLETVTPPEEQQPSKLQKFKEGFKEWLRKQIVGLKRHTHRIPLFVLLVAGLIYLFSLGSISQSVMDYTSLSWPGISSFVGTLFSILVLITYMRAYPKRKKTNIPMLVVTFVFVAFMIFMDVMFYVEFSNETAGITIIKDYYGTTTNVLITHIVFLGIAAVLMATLPLYKAALMKINTRKNIESTDIKEVIDTTDMD